MAKVGRPRKYNLGDVSIETVIAFDLANDISLCNNYERWPTGLYYKLIDFQNYLIKVSDPSKTRTLGDCADLYLEWQQERIARRKLI